MGKGYSWKRTQEIRRKEKERIRKIRRDKDRGIEKKYFSNPVKKTKKSWIIRLIEWLG